MWKTRNEASSIVAMCDRVSIAVYLCAVDGRERKRGKGGGVGESLREGKVLPSSLVWPREASG